ncbi:MAG: sugar ABC transporter substrate-binding protein [Bacteroidetes bacterium]|nr:sugar ABC transporter substrate-binding protein [Bacteroidota bacterium]
MKTTLGFALAFFLAFSGCQKKSQPNEIRFWAMGAEGEKVKLVIPEFEKENPGVTVSVQMIPWTAAHEKLVTAVASGTEPDLTQLGNTWIPEFVALGALKNLDSLANQSESATQSKFFEGVWETNVLDKNLYGIPWYVDTRVMFYRKDVFRKAGYDHPPKTWDELRDLCEKIKKLPGNSKNYAIYLPANEWSHFVTFGLQAGSPILKDSDTRGAFSDPEFRRSFTYLMSFLYDSLAPPRFTEVTNVYQAIEQGFFSIYMSGPWNIPEFKKRLPAHLQSEWMTAPLPGPDNQYPGYSLAGGSSLVMFRNSKNPELTWKFVEFLSRKSTQLKFFNVSGDLPAVKEAWQDSVFLADPYLAAFRQQLDHVKSTPKIPEWEQIAFSRIQTFAELATARKLTIDQTLKQLDESVNIILEKRRWYLEKIGKVKP